MAINMKQIWKQKCYQVKIEYSSHGDFCSLKYEDKSGNLIGISCLKCSASDTISDLINRAKDEVASNG